MMAAYAYYRAGKSPEAIASAERYVALHPGTKEAPLAYHIIASAYYDDMKTPSRDQTPARKALEALKTLKTRYPEASTRRTRTIVSASCRTISRLPRWRLAATT